MEKALKRSTPTKALRSQRDPQSHKKTKRLKLNLGVSLPHPVLPSFLCGEFLLHIPCCLHFYSGSFSYTSHAGFIFIRGVSLTHPVLASFLFWEFLLHIQYYFHTYLGSFSYTSRAAFIFMWGVSLTHPVLSFYSRSFSYTSRAGFIFFLESFSYTSRAGFLFFLLFFLFFLGSFSYTSPAGFIFIRGVSFTHPMLTSFLSGEFLLHIPCWLFFFFFWGGGGVGGLLHTPYYVNFYLRSFSYTSRASFIFYLGSFSYTYRAAFIFMRGVSLTHPVLSSFLFGEFLLHIQCWFHFLFGEFLLRIPC